MNRDELEQLARQLMLAHHDPKLGAPGPGTRAWEEHLDVVVLMLEGVLSTSGPDAVRGFVADRHEKLRWNQAAALRQIDFDLRSGPRSPSQQIADQVLVLAYRPSADMPLPGSFAFERVRTRLAEIIEDRRSRSDGVLVTIDATMVSAVRAVLLESEDEVRRDVVRAAEEAAGR